MVLIRSGFICFCLLISQVGFTQSAYINSISKTLFSGQLNDSVEIEITVPTTLSYSAGITYPVVYLLDMQNEINYNYHLQTLDYLTNLSGIPPCIVVGINFDWRNRNKWTTPNISGGKADDLIDFMNTELREYLASLFPIANFTILVGHSRTAIFASYALSKSFKNINGVIACSTANFDFGDANEKKQFELMLQTIDQVEGQRFLTYSSGTAVQNDYHEQSVDSFSNYISNIKLPKNLTVNNYKEPVDHFVIPGLTVNRALAQIFESYRTAAIQSINLVAEQKFNDSIPWNQLKLFYTKQSEYYGFEIKPDLLFYNSIASTYANDYDSVFLDNKLTLALEVLLEGVKWYPKDYSLNIWISEIYFEKEDIKNSLIYAKRSYTCLLNDDSISALDKKEILNEIEQFIVEIETADKE